jgi:hypothetical protein
LNGGATPHAAGAGALAVAVANGATCQPSVSAWTASATACFGAASVAASAAIDFVPPASARRIERKGSPATSIRPSGSGTLSAASASGTRSPKGRVSNSAMSSGAPPLTKRSRRKRVLPR